MPVLYLRVLVEVVELLLLVGCLMMMMMILMVSHQIRDTVHIFPKLLVLSNLSEPILQASC